MTNRKLVEQVFLSVTGGRPTDEHGVWREDIANLLSAALAFALNGKHWEERSKFYEQLRQTGIAPRDYMAELYITETVAVLTDGDKKYIPVPDYQVVSGTRGFDAVLTKEGYRILYSERSEDVLPLTMIATAYKSGDRIYLQNIVCDEMAIRYLPNYADISVEKELPFPDDTIYRTVVLLEEYFRRQAGYKDTIVNNNLDAVQEPTRNS